VELETDYLDQICLEVDETIERAMQVTEKALTGQASTVDKLLNAQQLDAWKFMQETVFVDLSADIRHRWRL
jgi:hypothetical protein